MGRMEIKRFKVGQVEVYIDGVRIEQSELWPTWEECEEIWKAEPFYFCRKVVEGHGEQYPPFNDFEDTGIPDPTDDLRGPDILKVLW